MKPFTSEDKTKVQVKLEKIHRNLEMYKRYEMGLLSFQGVSETMMATAKKIPDLRSDKAREVYTIVKKYGWLSNKDLDDEYYGYLLEGLTYGVYDILLSILPYAKKGFQLGKMSEEEYTHLLDLINTQKIEIENGPKTLN